MLRGIFGLDVRDPGVVGNMSRRELGVSVCLGRLPGHRIAFESRLRVGDSPGVFVLSSGYQLLAKGQRRDVVRGTIWSRYRLAERARVERRDLGLLLEGLEVDVIVDRERGLQDALEVLDPATEVLDHALSLIFLVLDVETLLLTLISHAGTLSRLDRAFLRRNRPGLGALLGCCETRSLTALLGPSRIQPAPACHRPSVMVASATADIRRSTKSLEKHSHGRGLVSHDSVFYELRSRRRP